MNARKRGWVLMELMTAISLVAVALSIAAVLIGRSMALTDRAADADAITRTFEQMQTMLGRDISAANDLQITPTQIVTPTVAWRIEPGRATRDADDQLRVFETPTATLRFDRAPYGVTLVIESASHEPTRVALVNVQVWGKESLR
jgi:type II secretory pathway pseudopilin PulG